MPRFALPVLLLAGCGVDLAVAPGVAVRCESDADCVGEGAVCRTNVGRCVLPEESGDGPGLLGTPSLRPELLGPTSTLEGDFVLEGPLFGIPLVRVAHGDDELQAEVSLVDGAAAQVALSFVCPLALSDGEDQVAVEVEAVDPLGNTAVHPLGQVPVDLTPPEILALDWDPVPATQPVPASLALRVALRADSDAISATLTVHDTGGPVGDMLVALSSEGVGDSRVLIADGLFTPLTAGLTGELKLFVTAHVSDALGNSTESSTSHVLVDASPLSLTFDTPPPASTTDGAISFALSTTGDEVRCGLDGALAPCPLTPSFDDLLTGNHLFTAEVQDQNGNVTTLQHSFTVSRVWQSFSVHNTGGCGVSADGKAWCWGKLSTFLPRWSPSLALSQQRWQTVVLGADMGCGIDRQGVTRCFGRGGEALGDAIGIDSDVDMSFVVADDHSFTTLAVGGEADSGPGARKFVCAVDDRGAAWCWGDNGLGQLGKGDSGDLTTRARPMAVDAPGPFVKLAAGVRHACGLRDDDSLWCWGDDTWEPPVLPSPTVVPSPVEVAAPDAGGWQDVVAGDRFTCGLSMTHLYCWGHDDGTLLDTGDVQLDEPAPVPVSPDGDTWDRLGAVSLTRQGLALCARSTSGMWWCRGNNHAAWLGTGSFGGTGWQALLGDYDNVALGEFFGCGQSGATVACWGNTEDGRVGAVPRTRAELTATPEIIDELTWLSAGISECFGCGLTSDGHLSCWGPSTCGYAEPLFAANVETPAPFGPDVTWKRLSVATRHACGIRDDDSMWCWGDGAAGQLGNGGSTFSAVPVQEDLGLTWSELTTVGEATCAITTDQHLYCWGGYVQQAPVPTGDPGWADWLAMATVGYNGCGLRATGTDEVTLWCWGAIGGAATQLGGDLDWLEVASGDNGFCGLRQGGSLWCWDGIWFSPGYSPTPMSPPGDPGGWAHVFGPEGTCVTDVDGAVTCFGSRGGVMGLPGTTSVTASDNNFCAITGGRRACWGRSSGYLTIGFADALVESPRSLPAPQDEAP